MHKMFDRSRAPGCGVLPALDTYKSGATGILLQLLAHPNRRLQFPKALTPFIQCQQIQRRYNTRTRRFQQ